MVQLKNGMTIESSSNQPNVEVAKAGGSSLAVESVSPMTNRVLQMLLRRPRYFDLPKWSSSGSPSDEEYPRFRKKQKICHYCGADHFTTNCEQIKRMFVFSSKGQLIMKRPDTDSDMDRTSVLCLKCGETGHDMFSCSNGYDSSDLKETWCYVCKEYGHLCCTNNSTGQEVAVSCYNCGQSGHNGHECPELKEVSLCSNSEPRDQSLQELNKNPEDNPTVITTQIKDAAAPASSGKKARRARHRRNQRAAKKLLSIANQPNIGNNISNATEANQPNVMLEPTNVGPPGSNVQLSPARNRQPIPQSALDPVNQQPRYTMGNAQSFQPPPRHWIELPQQVEHGIHPTNSFDPMSRLIWNNQNVGQRVQDPRPTGNVGNIIQIPQLPRLDQGICVFPPQSGHSPAALPHQSLNPK